MKQKTFFNKKMLIFFPPIKKYIHLSINIIPGRMKKISFFLIFLTFFSLKAQEKIIQGQVFDKITGAPLAFATVFLENKNGVTADEKGNFVLKIPTGVSRFHVSYTGYETAVVPLIPNKTKYKILLIPSHEKLQTVEIKSPTLNRGRLLVQKAVKRKYFNDYRKFFHNMAMDYYYRFKLTADKDSLNCAVDTVTIFYNGKKKTYTDSLMYHFCRNLDKNEIYMMENINRRIWKYGKEYKTVLATRTAGFKNPAYEILQLQFSGKNPYDDFYQIMFKEYPGPFSKKAIKLYNYRLLDTLKIQGQKVYKVAFKKKKPPHISGEIYLDAINLSLAKLHIKSEGNLKINTLFLFHYFPKWRLWIPVLQKSIIRSEGNLQEIELGSYKIKNRIKGKPLDSVYHTNPQQPGDFIYARIVDSLTGIKRLTQTRKEIMYDLQIAPDAGKKNEDFWFAHTRRYLTMREKNTYKLMDSLFAQENIEGKINKYKKLFYGKLPMGKIDLNLGPLFSINRYENFRMELNFTTNHLFSSKWGLDSYIAYGTKDKDWKYHAGISYKFSHRHQTFLKLAYTKDLKKAAVFKDMQQLPFYRNWLRHYPWEKFALYKEVSLKLDHLFRQNLGASINLARGDYSSKFTIPFHPGRIEFPEYDLTYANIQLQWEPNTKFMLDNEGRKRIKKAFPVYLFSIESNFPFLQTNSRYFLRSELQALYRKTHINKNFTDLKLQVGINYGQPRIEQMFQPDFNDFREDKIWKHIYIPEKYAFETIKDGEFYNNYVITAHLSHRFNKVKSFRRRTMDIRISLATAYGFAWDENLYAGSSDLRYGLFETGIEFHRLFKALGLGFYHRWGHYTRHDINSDFSIRINFEPLGFFMD